MATNRLRLVKLLQVFHLFLSKSLAAGCESFVHSFNAAETNDWTADFLIDPRQGNVGHIPSLLVRQFFDALDNLAIGLT
jgi:hypothetical protein